MKTLDNITQANQAMWEAEVQKGGGYTQPWLDLDVAELRQLAAAGPWLRQALSTRGWAHSLAAIC